jgi:hypothetical protein
MRRWRSQQCAVAYARTADFAKRLSRVSGRRVAASRTSTRMELPMRTVLAGRWVNIADADQDRGARHWVAGPPSRRTRAGLTLGRRQK